MPICIKFLKHRCATPKPKFSTQVWTDPVRLNPGLTHFLEIVNKTYVQEQTTLQRKIFKDYNRKIRPVKNQSLPIKVQLHVYLMHFSVDQIQQTILLNGHIYMVGFLK